MARIRRIIPALLALAALLLAGPVAHWGHSHDPGESCRSGGAHGHRHACDHGHRHGSDADAADGGESSGEPARPTAPASEHDCSICQALAAPALPVAIEALELRCDAVESAFPPGESAEVQRLIRAYRQRGPPAA